MATTTPFQFTGTPTLTPEKVAAIEEWYRSALADSDKADADDEPWYSGQHEMAEAVLRLLFDMPAPEEPQSVTPAADPAADARRRAQAEEVRAELRTEGTPAEDALPAERSLFQQIADVACDLPAHGGALDAWDEVHALAGQGCDLLDRLAKAARRRVSGAAAQESRISEVHRLLDLMGA